MRRLLLGVFVFVCVLTLVLLGGVGRGSFDPRPFAARAATAPWLVYQTITTVGTGGCAESHEVHRLRTWPGGGLLPSKSGWTANDPAWSPDGKRVAFSSGGMICTNGDGVGQGGAQIWVVDSSGRSLRVITKVNPVTGGPVDRSPTWSPDGRRIAFARYDPTDVPGTEGLYVVGADGRGLTRLSRQTALSLDWSPDGRSLAFTDGNWGVFGWLQGSKVGLLDLGSGRVRTYRVTGDPFDVAWSPDSRSIAVTGNKVISILTTTGKVVRRIPVAGRGNAWLNAVTWSPNGRQLAYSLSRPKIGDTIFTVGVDGRDTKRIAPGTAPDWKP